MVESQRPGPGPASVEDPFPTADHVVLVAFFDRSPTTLRTGSDDQHRLWASWCLEVGLSPSPLALVRSERARLLAATSIHTRLALASPTDPACASVAVLYRGQRIAGHTTSTDALLGRLLLLHARRFATPEAFGASLSHHAETAWLCAHPAVPEPPPGREPEPETTP